MLIPISWLKEYVDIQLPLEKLMWKMTEAGLTCESFTKVGDEIILDVEVTPNRADWMSVIGIAREIAAIQNSNLRFPKISEIPKPKKSLPIKLKSDPELFERWTAIIISDVSIKPAPTYMQERLKLVGLRPINNVVDTTNYVMFELGIPLHAFDYDAIEGQEMTVTKSEGAELFTTVDEITYTLPKDAIIIKDKKRIIDLAGIKGGQNSGIKHSTKNILLHVTIDNPVLIRRASQKMGLRSEASAIYQRGPDKGATVIALKRAANLISENAGGKVASKLIDIKAKDFEPLKLKLNLGRLEKILGIKIKDSEVVNILRRLNLSPELQEDEVVCTIPTYRSDLKIEEDLIEEVSRLWGYNKFPRTLPMGALSPKKVPYYYDRGFEVFLKELMVATGYSEVMTLSLISADLINKSQLHIDNHIRIENPVSAEYEYLRTSLVPSLLVALDLNSNQNTVKLFEFAKTYFGPLGKTSEPYKIAAIEKGIDFRSLKGVVDLIFERLNIDFPEIKPTLVDSGLWHPTKSAVLEAGDKMIGTFGEIHPKVLNNFGIKIPVFTFEMDVDTLKNLRKEKVFKEVSKYPPQIEDVTLVFPPKTKVGEAIAAIKATTKLVSKVELTDIYNDAYTFHIWYQHPEKTLTDKEVQDIRKRFLKKLKEKFGVLLKT